MPITPEFIAGAALALQGWTLRQVISLKEDVAEIKATCRARNECGHAHEETNKTEERIELVKAKRRKSMRIWGALAALGMLAWMLTGCGTVGGTFKRGEVAMLVTNAVPVQTVTTTQPPPTIENPNPAPVVVTNTVLREIVTVQTNAVYGVSEQAGAILTTARAVNAVIPSPVGGLIDGGLVLLTALLGTIAGVKSRAASAAGDKAALAEAMLKAAIAGVEAVGHEATKASIANAAAGAGVAAQLDGEVQRVAAYVSGPSVVSRNPNPPETSKA